MLVPSESRVSCRVALIVPNWNGRRYLEMCLPSVFSQRFRDFSVILVDNGSTDDSVEWVREYYPQVHIIQNSENRGFAIANNQAIRGSSSEFVATLNNDTQVEAGWLGGLVKTMEADSRIGMCASKMLLAGKENKIEAAGIAVDRAGMIWNRRDESETVFDYCSITGSPELVFGACAGAALYRRSMLNDVGLFDEDFFLYMEDVDLAWRAQWAAWRCAYVPDAVVHHVHSGTSKERSHFKNRMLGRNKIWVLCKNYPFKSYYTPLVIAYDLMSVMYAIVAGRDIGALWGRLEALSKIPRMLAKRRQIVRRIHSREMLALLHPVESALDVLRRYTPMRP